MTMPPAIGLFHDRLRGTEPAPEFAATYTLEQHVAEARRLMGEDRWTQLMQDWEREA